MAQVVVEPLVVAGEGFGLLALALVLVLEGADVVAQLVGGFVVFGSEVLVLGLCVAQLVLCLAQLDGGVVVLALEFVEACVVGAEFLVHAVLEFDVAAVILLEAVFEGLDLVAGFFEFGLGVVGFALKVVDVGVLLGEDLGLVALELVEVAEDEFVVSVGFLVVFGDGLVALEALLVVGGDLG